jgi:hypothetical protein
MEFVRSIAARTSTERPNAFSDVSEILRVPSELHAAGAGLAGFVRVAHLPPMPIVILSSKTFGSCWSGGLAPSQC